MKTDQKLCDRDNDGKNPLNTILPEELNSPIRYTHIYYKLFLQNFILGIGQRGPPVLPF